MVDQGGLFIAVGRFEPDDDARSLPNLNVAVSEQLIGFFNGFLIGSAFIDNECHGHGELLSRPAN
jgi:hypothetical protein